jgi:hypothetical protein
MTVKQRSEAAGRRRGEYHRESGDRLAQAMSARRRLSDRAPFPVRRSAQWEADRKGRPELGAR